MTQFVIFHISNIKWYMNHIRYDIRRKIFSLRFIKIFMMNNTVYFIMVVLRAATYINRTTHLYAIAKK